MAHAACRHFNSRQAIAAAVRLGWPVREKAANGEVEIIDTDGRRHLIQAPGRRGDDYISMRLRKVLSKALIERGE